MDKKIKIGKGILNQFPKLINLKKYSNLFLVIDENVKKKFPKDDGKIIIQGREQAKNIETIQKIWQAMLDFKCDRKSLVINIGGGTIGDVGGFAASTYMRGVDFIQIPTTLLAQVDASVGGKVGINFAGIKNLIGTFQQPVAVIIDVEILAGLPKREFISGFAEIIKHGVIADKKYFEFVTSKKPQDFSPDELIEIIRRSIQIKFNIVSADEKESGLRKILNFGHTIGHAIEALSQETSHPLLHGEALGIGMTTEGNISEAIGLLSNEEYKILEQAITAAGLPTKLPPLSTNGVLEKIKSDKKNEEGKINWTLIQGIGKAVYNQSVDDGIVRKVLYDSH